MNPGFACLRPLYHGICGFGSVQTDILSHEPEMVILAHFTLANTASKTGSKGVIYMHGMWDTGCEMRDVGCEMRDASKQTTIIF